MIIKDLDIALTAALEDFSSDQVCVIVDRAIEQRWHTLCLRTYPTLVIKDAEDSKDLNGIERIWDFLLDRNITRRGVIISVGGGAMSDLVGFAAATYKRGIAYINIPTTLLAMVDAGSGGKTGINYNGIKNAIGAFHSPISTLIYPYWLTDLPVKQLLSGFGEVIKSALLSDEIEWNNALRYDLDICDINALSPLIESSLSYKRHIVESDPFENGERKVLNFGHTIGHALEAMSKGQMLHGYAVMYGMIAELYLSVILLGCPKEPLQQLTQLVLHYYGKPDCKCSDREEMIALMLQDKKNEHADQICCTLLKNIGEPIINQVITKGQINEALDYLDSI